MSKPSLVWQGLARGIGRRPQSRPFRKAWLRQKFSRTTLPNDTPSLECNHRIEVRNLIKTVRDLNERGLRIEACKSLAYTSARVRVKHAERLIK